MTKIEFTLEDQLRVMAYDRSRPIRRGDHDVGRIGTSERIWSKTCEYTSTPIVGETQMDATAA